jgi:hypothetical protein
LIRMAPRIHRHRRRPEVVLDAIVEDTAGILLWAGIVAKVRDYEDLNSRGNHGHLLKRLAPLRFKNARGPSCEPDRKGREDEYDGQQGDTSYRFWRCHGQLTDGAQLRAARRRGPATPGMIRLGRAMCRRRRHCGAVCAPLARRAGRLLKRVVRPPSHP